MHETKMDDRLECKAFAFSGDHIDCPTFFVIHTATFFVSWILFFFAHEQINYTTQSYLFSSWKFLDFDTVALSLLFDN